MPIVVIDVSEALRPEERVEQVKKEQDGQRSGENQFHGQSLSHALTRLHIAPKKTAAIRT
jgi:hypothetical protein